MFLTLKIMNIYNSKLLDNKMSKKIKFLNSNNLLRGLGYSLVGIFIPTYLLTMGYSLNNIFSYFLVMAITSFVSTIFSLSLGKKFGYKPLIILSIPLAVVSLFLLNLLQTNEISIYLIAVIFGIQNGTYYLPLHAYFTKLSEKIKRGEQYSNYVFFGQLAGLLSPIVGAILATFLNFSTLFYAAIFFISLSIIPLFNLENIKPKTSLEFSKIKDLKSELLYLNKLKQSNFPYSVPEPLKISNGNNLIKYKKGNWWLYKYIEGKIAEPLSLKQILELAKMVAIYHNAIEEINLSNKKPKTKDFDKKTTLKGIEKLRKETASIKKKKLQNVIFLEELDKILPLLKSIKNKLYNKLPQYALHRDLNPENILWKNNELIGVIDFENVGTMNENFVTDLAFTIMFSATTEKEHKLNIRKTKEFVRTYQKYRKLSKKEISLIPDIITIGWIGAFSWQYWLHLYDVERAQIHRLKLYSNAAQWTHKNKNKIITALLKSYQP